MDTISPTLAQAYQLLCVEIYRYLDDTEYLAQHDWRDERERQLVRKVIEDLVTIVRAIVALHKASDTGRCTTCGTPWPCRITETVHALVKDPERAFMRIVAQINGLA